MFELTASLLQDIGTSWIVIVRWFNAIVPVLKIMSLIISGLLIYGIIHAIIKSGYMVWLYDRIIDGVGRKDLAERRARRIWMHAVQLIQNSTDRNAWIEALKEADGIMNEGLKMQGYRALGVDDRIRIAVEAGALHSGEELQSAHELFKQTLQNPDCALTHDAVVRALRTYKKVIKELGFKI